MAGVYMIIHPEIGDVDTTAEARFPSSGRRAIAQGEMMAHDAPFLTATSGSPEAVPQPHRDVTAAAYLVANIITGEIYLSSHADTVFPVASMSKLMTAIVGTDIFTASTSITITTEEASTSPDTSNLTAGEKFSFNDLLYPLLLNSSNVAAEAIASSTTRLNFMDMMSNTAWEVDMPTAYFADPSGIDPHNHASARDIFALGRYLYQYRPDILAITRIPHAAVATTTEHGSHNFDSIHPFVLDPRFIGGKTGRTREAGETMLTILQIGDQPIAFVILHADFGMRAYDTNVLIKKFMALSQDTPVTYHSTE